MIRWLCRAGAFVVLLAVVVGCARYEDIPTGTVRDIHDESSAILELQEVRVPPPDPESDLIVDYRVGPGDVLLINVPGLIERREANVFTDRTHGYRVSSNGMILLPLIGAVDVQDLTVEDIQKLLTEKSRVFIKQPLVSVEIKEFKSQPLYLLGKFNNPGLHFLDRPTPLLHGIAMGHGLAIDADLRSARLLRSNQLLPVDIYQLLHSNDLRQNVQLRPGDTIYVPGNEEQQVFVFGAVRQPGPVPMVNGRLNLLQALSSTHVGGSEREIYPYDQEHIRIIRSLSPTRGQLLVVDLGRMVDGYAMPLPLMNGDIIYVPQTPVGSWNAAISKILPSLQLISALMQPFVQLEFLRDNY